MVFTRLSGRKETSPDDLDTFHSHPSSGEPACSLKVSGPVQLATPPSVVVFAKPPSQGTKAWTRLDLSFFAVAGCSKLHCALAVLATKPRAKMATNVTSGGLFIGRPPARIPRAVLRRWRTAP